jgi:hypothetical protein
MSLTTGQTSIGTAATLITTGIVGASYVLLHTSGNTTIYLGGSAVTTSTGLELHKANTVTLWLPQQDSLYGVVSSGTETVTFMHTGGK